MTTTGSKAKAATKPPTEYWHRDAGLDGMLGTEDDTVVSNLTGAIKPAPTLPASHGTPGTPDLAAIRAKLAAVFDKK